jgi:hypothetical protein
MIDHYKHHVIPFHEWKARINSKAKRWDRAFNAPDNVVWLTHEQHTQVHKLYYEDRGLLGDKLAWKCWAGLIGQDEMRQIKNSIGGKTNKGKPKSDDHRKNLSIAVTGRKCGTWSPEYRQRFSLAQKGKPRTPRTPESIQKQKNTITGKKRGPYKKKLIDRPQANQ